MACGVWRVCVCVVRALALATGTSSVHLTPTRRARSPTGLPAPIVLFHPCAFFFADCQRVLQARLARRGRVVPAAGVVTITHRPSHPPPAAVLPCRPDMLRVHTASRVSKRPPDCVCARACVCVYVCELCASVITAWCDRVADVGTTSFWPRMSCTYAMRPTQCLPCLSTTQMKLNTCTVRLFLFNNLAF